MASAEDLRCCKAFSTTMLNCRWCPQSDTRITRKRIRRGSFYSVAELVAAIEEYIRVNNQNPKPFVWTKRAEEILEKLRHCKATSVTQH